MGALAGIVAFILIFNTSLPFVNSLGITSQQFVYASNANITAIQAAGGCSANTTAGSNACGFDFGAQQNPITTLITFGNFMWSALKFAAFLPIAVALPAYLLVSDFYAPISLAAIYNVAMWIIMMYFFNTMISGRYITEIP